MKRLLSLLVLLVPLISFSGNNDIYLTQSGTGLTLTIDQIGATNKVGTSQARVSLTGTTMTVDIDQIGNTNTFAATIAQGNTSSWTYKAEGNENEAPITVGGTGDVAGSDFDYDALGSSNVLVFTQGDASTATSGNQDFDVDGTSNNVNVKCNVVGCKNDWTVVGNSNDIDTVQSGSANHNITVVLTGGGNDFDVDQTDTASTNVADIIATTTNGTIDIDQCASGC